MTRSSLAVASTVKADRHRRAKQVGRALILRMSVLSRVSTQWMPVALPGRVPKPAAVPKTLTHPIVFHGPFFSRAKAVSWSRAGKSSPHGR